MGSKSSTPVASAPVNVETVAKIAEARHFITEYQKAVKAGQTADDLAATLGIDRKKVASKKNQFQALLQMKFKPLKASGQRGRGAIYTPDVVADLSKLAAGLAK